MLNDLSMHL